MTPPPRPTLAASVAVFRDGRALVARRGRGPGAGLFSLPGGRVEAGERLEEAALRELAEETGVLAEIVAFNRFLEIIDRDADGRLAHHFVVATFVARWISGEGEASPEAEEILWIGPDGLAGLPTTRGLARTLRRAREILEAA